MVEAGVVVGFFETDAELECVRTRKPDLLVALTPEADYAAGRRKLDYLTIEDLYSEDELLAAGATTLQSAQLVADTIDVALAAQGLHERISARTYVYLLKRMLDNVLHGAFALESAFRTFAPSRVIAFEPRYEAPTDELWFVNESLWRSTLHLIGREQRVAVEMMAPPEEAQGPVAPAPTQTVTTSLQRIVLRRCKWEAGRVARLLARAVQAAAHEPATVVVGEGWPGLADVSKYLARHRVAVLPFDVLLPPTLVAHPSDSSFAAVAEDVLGSPAVSDAFRLGDIDLRPLVRSRLEHFLLRMIPRHAQLERHLRNELGRIPQSVIASAFPAGVAVNALVDAARGIGLPTTSCQHGGLNGYFEYPLLGFTDVQARLDAYLCYGEGVARHAERDVLAPLRAMRPVLLPVGSAALDRFGRHVARSRGLHRSRGARRHVVYAPTWLSGNLRYFSWHTLPDIHFWRVQREVVHACVAAADVELTVKLYPRGGLLRDMVPNPLEAWAADELSVECRFVSDVPLSELCTQADLVLIDAPATTLLELATTRLPIILYADSRFFRPDPEAISALRRRLTGYCTSSDEFIATIRETLAAPELPVALRDDDFVRAYGTYLGDGRSAERAAAILEAAARHGHFGAG